jgi:Fic family protein
VPRHERSTRPVATRDGILTTYAELESRLSEGEARGRVWAIERAQAHRAANAASIDRLPSDADMLDLHRVMFDPIFDWAGTPRKKDVGPGGHCNVPWPEVREQLRKFALDMRAWLAWLLKAEPDPSLESIARLISDAHHRFQWIHPFEDTNGRTGRVLDHYLLWVTLDFAATDLRAAPVILYFPTSDERARYYDALANGDNGRLASLAGYYLDRLTDAFNAIGATESLPPP